MTALSRARSQHKGAGRSANAPQMAHSSQLALQSWPAASDWAAGSTAVISKRGL
jgi:hypothetical protein